VDGRGQEVAERRIDRPEQGLLVLPDSEWGRGLAAGFLNPLNGLGTSM
jgi:hypothetical protein